MGHNIACPFDPSLPNHPVTPNHTITKGTADSKSEFLKARLTGAPHGNLEHRPFADTFSLGEYRDEPFDLGRGLKLVRVFIIGQP